jgi:hypothetical protein
MKEDNLLICPGTGPRRCPLRGQDAAPPHLRHLRISYPGLCSGSRTSIFLSTLPGDADLDTAVGFRGEGAQGFRFEGGLVLRPCGGFGRVGDHLVE